MGGLFRSASGGVVGGKLSLNTAGSIAYVASAGVLGQDPTFARSAAGRYTLYDSTPTTGVTTFVLQAGAGQSAANLQEWKNAAGTTLASMSSAGALSVVGLTLNGNPILAVNAISYISNFSLQLNPAVHTAAITGGASVRVNPTYNVSGTGVANTDFLVNRTETSLGTSPGTQNLLDLQVGGSSKLRVDRAGSIVGTLTTPASAAATGAAGTIVWDANYIYVCTATNTWKRVAIATW